MPLMQYDMCGPVKGTTAIVIKSVLPHIFNGQHFLDQTNMTTRAPAKTPPPLQLPEKSTSYLHASFAKTLMSFYTNNNDKKMELACTFAKLYYLKGLPLYEQQHPFSLEAFRRSAEIIKRHILNTMEDSHDHVTIQHFSESINTFSLDQCMVWCGDPFRGPHDHPFDKIKKTDSSLWN